MNPCMTYTELGRIAPSPQVSRANFRDNCRTFSTLAVVTDGDRESNVIQRQSRLDIAACFALGGYLYFIPRFSRRSY